MQRSSEAFLLPSSSQINIDKRQKQQREVSKKSQSALENKRVIKKQAGDQHKMFRLKKSSVLNNTASSNINNSTQHQSSTHNDILHDLPTNLINRKQVRLRNHSLAHPAECQIY